MIRKLQKAIAHKGLAIAISHNQFYSQDRRCFITVIILSTKVTCYSKRKEKWMDKNYEILRSTSYCDVLNCLVDIYRAVTT